MTLARRSTLHLVFGGAGWRVGESSGRMQGTGGRDYSGGSSGRGVIRDEHFGAGRQRKVFLHPSAGRSGTPFLTVSPRRDRLA